MTDSKLTPDPARYSSVEGTCVACRKPVKLQVLPVTGEIRCPEDGRTWPGPDAYTDELAARVPDEAKRLRPMLANSARAMGVDNPR